MTIAIAICPYIKIIPHLICLLESVAILSNRPVYYSIKPVIMFNEWGSPNTQVVVLIAFSLTFYEISIRNKRIDKSFVGKIIMLIIISLIVFFDVFLLFASGNIAYNQLIGNTDRIVCPRHFYA